MEDPRPTAPITHEPPVIVASGERRSTGVRRASSAVRGIPLSDLNAVAAPVFRHGPSRNPAGLINPNGRARPRHRNRYAGDRGFADAGRAHATAAARTSVHEG